MGPQDEPRRARVTRLSSSLNWRGARRMGAALALAAVFAAGAALSALGGDTLASAFESGESGVTVECGATPTADTSGGADQTSTEPSCGETTTATSDGTSTEASTTTPSDPGETSTETGTETAPTETGPIETGGDTETTSTDGDTGSGSTSTGESDDSTPPPDTTPEPGDDPASDGSGNGEPSPSGSTEGGPVADPVRDPSTSPPAVDPEFDELVSSGAVIWLHRTLPDPVPRAQRLEPAFARMLRQIAHQHNVSWDLVLAVVRASGGSGSRPATPGELDRVATRLAAAGLVGRPGLGPRTPVWRALLGMSGRTAFADRVLALARYDRAVGLQGLVSGLERVANRLARRVLADWRIEIYSGGRADIAAGRINVRVLVLLRYLRIGFGSVTVSSLTSGHRFFARPGVVSAHVFGLAADISRLGGVPISGHQQPESVTERAVASILRLPLELRPQQVISLLGLGGPSFPLADHYDHIHVGF